MSSSDVQICNLALAHIGINTQIASLDESTTEATVCSLMFEPSRDLVLEAFPWHFARATKVLAQLEDPPDEWAYKFQMPTDCIQARNIKAPGIRTPDRAARIPFQISTEDDVLVLYCDIEEPELVYTRRVDNPGLYTPSFVMALSLYIGSQVAMPLSAAPGLADKCADRYRMAIAAAGALSLSAGQEDIEPDGEFITARR